MSIETILAEHELVWDESGSWAVCDCGRHPYPQSLAPDDLPAAHHAHQADRIRAELTGDEVVEAVAWVLHESRCDGECPIDGGDETDARAALAAAVTALGGNHA